MPAGSVTDPDGPGRYRHLQFNAPLSEARADAIAGRLAAASPAEVLDIGCGWGELLLRVLEQAPAAVGTGIDTDAGALERGREGARRRGLAERARFREVAADDVTGRADVVICIGASHAWGGTTRALAAIAELLRTGGRLLLGDGLWNPHARVPDRSLAWDDMRELPISPG